MMAVRFAVNTGRRETDENIHCSSRNIHTYIHPHIGMITRMRRRQRSSCSCSSRHDLRSQVSVRSSRLCGPTTLGTLPLSCSPLLAVSCQLVCLLLPACCPAFDRLQLRASLHRRATLSKQTRGRDGLNCPSFTTTHRGHHTT